MTSAELTWSLVCYYMGWNLESLGLIWLNHCLVYCFFQCFFLLSTQKAEANFKTFQLNLYTITDVANYIIFYAMKSLQQAKIKSLHFLFFSCSFYTWHSFTLAEPRLSIWTRQIVLSLDVWLILLIGRMNRYIHSPNKCN